MKKPNVNNTAKATAVRLLSRRDHSIFELKRKLRLREFPQEEIDDALDDLIKRDYISDARFSEAYVNMRKQKGFGPLRIAAELNERGVDEREYLDFLQPESDSWIVSLERTYQTKYRGLAYKDFNEKAKRIRFLQYRGFTLDKIHQVLKWFIKLHKTI